MQRHRPMIVALAVVIVAGPAAAVVLEDPANFAVKRTWSGPTELGIPANLGGLLFSADGATLYAVGNSERAASALYAVPVTRDPITHEVVDLGPIGSVTKVFDGNAATPGLDAGWDVGPAGTLFYTYWSANYLGQRPGGVAGAETLFDMATVGVPSSIAGLTFSPHVTDPGTGFGLMQISSWQGANLFNVPLTAAGGGVFTPGTVETFVTLPQQGTGAIQYVPSGPFAGDVMYVNWNYGEVRILDIDAPTGLPIDQGTMLPTLGTTNPVDERFASELGVGPWGLEFDPLTNDFFVGTWGGSPSNSILQIGGAGFPSTTTSTSTTTTSLPGSTVTTTTTSTTTIASTSTTSFTTTTLPGVRFLPGTKLLVKRKKSGAHRLQLLARGVPVAVASPCETDGELVIESVGAGAPVRRFTLDAARWKPIANKRPEKGCKYRKGAEVATVQLKTGKMLKVVVSADDVGVPLDDDPRPVRIEVRHGDVRHCLEFGGTKGKPLKAGKKLLARVADAATACPAQNDS